MSEHIDETKAEPMALQRLVLIFLLAACLAPPSSTFADRFDDYAAWWNRRNQADPELIVRDETGKRIYKTFWSPLNAPEVSAAAAEAVGTVRGPTFVLGISIGNEARAYPLHSIGELVNDRLNDVPIAATW